MQIISVANQKGGTGKTATISALAQAAAIQGKKVLCIDLDPQGNFTFTMAARPDGAGSFALLDGADPEELIQTISKSIDMIPASWGLATAGSFKGSARRLQKALGPLKKKYVYDYIFIDTPPTPGELQLNALQASTGLIIPLLADAYNLQSLYQTADTAKQIQRTNRDLDILGIVFTQYDQRSTISRQMRDLITAKAAERGIPSLGEIRNAIAVKEAAALQTSLFKYAPKSKPAQDYMLLFDQIDR